MSEIWDKLIARLGWADDPESQEILKREWESSQKELPGDGMFFLAPEYLTEACRILELPADARETLCAAAGRIAANPALAGLYFSGHIGCGPGG